jgi:hypothetical protein
MASLPISPRGLILKKSKDVARNVFTCDPTGARTQDPIIKSDVLYQLSYRVISIKKFQKNCDPTGARTQDPIIKSDVLYQLSYRVKCNFLNAGANIRPYYLFFKAILS